LVPRPVARWHTPVYSSLPSSSNGHVFFQPTIQLAYGARMLAAYCAIRPSIRINSRMSSSPDEREPCRATRLRCSGVHCAGGGVCSEKFCLGKYGALDARCSSTLKVCAAAPATATAAPATTRASRRAMMAVVCHV
jgi:hypothetical protein